VGKLHHAGHDGDRQRGGVHRAALHLGQRLRTQPAVSDAPGLHFLKMGYAGSEDWMTGHMYVFHNTVFQEDGWLPRRTGRKPNREACSLAEQRRPGGQDNGYSVSENNSNTDNDFDYDLYNGRVPKDQETHGCVASPCLCLVPVSIGRRSQAVPTGSKQPRAGQGLAIPNFSAGFYRPGTRRGAHQRGTPPLQFGVGVR